MEHVKEEKSSVRMLLGKWAHVFFPTLYALAMRILAEYDQVDIDSITFTILTPMALGFLPFFFESSGYRKSLLKALFYPFVSILLFLFITVQIGLEDLLCIVVIGFPYILSSLLVSWFTFVILKHRKENINKNYLPLIFLPFVLGPLENQAPKSTSSLEIKNEILLNMSEDELISVLYEVPQLNIQHDNYWLELCQVPLPSFSTFDSKKNTRIGHFTNGMTLFEHTVRKGNNLIFYIDFEKSSFAHVPTIKHVIDAKTLAFDYIAYSWTKRNDNQIQLTLSTKVKLHTNLQPYARFWTKILLDDFEKSLLKSLKKKIEADQ